MKLEILEGVKGKLSKATALAIMGKVKKEKLELSGVTAWFPKVNI